MEGMTNRDDEFQLLTPEGGIFHVMPSIVASKDAISIQRMMGRAHTDMNSHRDKGIDFCVRLKNCPRGWVGPPFLTF